MLSLLCVAPVDVETDDTIEDFKKMYNVQRGFGGNCRPKNSL